MCEAPFPVHLCGSACCRAEKERLWRAGRQLKNRPFRVLTNGATIGSNTDKGSNTRFALPRLLVRWEPGDTKEANVQTRLIEQVGKTLAPEEVAVFDAGFSLAEVRGLVPRFVVRMAKNDTVRRNFLPEYTAIQFSLNLPENTFKRNVTGSTPIDDPEGVGKN